MYTLFCVLDTYIKGQRKMKYAEQKNLLNQYKATINRQSKIIKEYNRAIVEDDIPLFDIIITGDTILKKRKFKVKFVNTTNMLSELELIQLQANCSNCIYKNRDKESCNTNGCFTQMYNGRMPKTNLQNIPFLSQWVGLNSKECLPEQADYPLSCDNCANPANECNICKSANNMEDLSDRFKLSFRCKKHQL